MEYKHRVNWADGMKINKDHFIDFENSMIQQFMVMNSNFVHKNNYGLLPDPGNSEHPVELSISMDGQENLIVRVNKCLAITIGGYQIIINPEINAYLEQSGHLIQNEFAISSDESLWYVVLSVNPYKRIPIGYADPNEEPIRKPFVIPSYKISVLSQSEVNKNEVALNSITIAKITRNGDRPELIENFIPPCVSVQSHPDLRYTFGQVGEFFNALELYATQVIQKIHQKKQANDLAKMVLTLSNDMLVYLRGMMATYRINDKHASPVAMVIKIINLARTIKGSLDVYVGTGKEELLNYLTDWCDVNQGAFENVLEQTIGLEYLHTDINDAIDNISEFTVLMSTLFKKLNELDYIGKKSDSNIFVKEDVIVEEQVKKRRRFFME